MKRIYREGAIALIDEIALINLAIFIVLYLLYDRGLISLSTLAYVMLAAIAVSALFILLVVRVQLRPPTVGKEALLGKKGRVIEPLKPEGKILVQGEIWRARTRDGGVAEEGSIVRVVGFDDMTLIVEREEA